MIRSQCAESIAVMIRRQRCAQTVTVHSSQKVTTHDHKRERVSVVCVTKPKYGALAVGWKKVHVIVGISQCKNKPHLSCSNNLNGQVSPLCFAQHTNGSAFFYPPRRWRKASCTQWLLGYIARAHMAGSWTWTGKVIYTDNPVHVAVWYACHVGFGYGCRPAKRALDPQFQPLRSL